MIKPSSIKSSVVGVSLSPNTYHRGTFSESEGTDMFDDESVPFVKPNQRGPSWWPRSVLPASQNCMISPLSYGLLGFLCAALSTCFSLFTNQGFKGQNSTCLAFSFFNFGQGRPLPFEGVKS